MKPLFAILIVFISIFSTKVCAQIEVSSAGQNADPNYLVGNVLIGDGVEITNLQSYGNPMQFGFFKNGMQDVGMDSGIVISTGLAEALSLDYDLGGAAMASERFLDNATQGGGDADLLQLAKETAQKLNIAEPSRTDDAAFVSFDFVAVSEEIEFNFAFASEEYENYENTYFNDVFGFFLAGPGVNGNYSKPVGYPGKSANLAQVPGQDLGISVSSINTNRNSQFYRINSGNIASHYNGFTTVLTIKFQVVSCEQYHFRFAIADGQASDFDSAVLLEAGGFSSEKFASKAESTFGVNSAFYEGCGNAIVEYERLTGFTGIDSLAFSIDPSGTADANDISALPPYLVFAPGEVSKTISFQILDDGLPEDDEVLILKAERLSGCSRDILTDFTLINYTPHSLIPSVNDTIPFSCPGLSFPISGNAQEGYGFYKYRWYQEGVLLNGENDSILMATPDTVGGFGHFTLEIGDSCTSNVVQKEFVFRYSPPGRKLEVFLPADTNLSCSDTPLDLSPDSVVGGALPVDYFWLNMAGDTLTNDYTLTQTFSESEQFVFGATDACGIVIKDTILVDVAEYTPLRVTQNWRDTAICAGDFGTLTWAASGGAGNYTADWGDGFNPQAQSRSLSPKEDSTIFVEIFDACLESKTLQFFLDVNSPIADFELIYTNAEVFVDNFSEGRYLQYQWYLDDEFLTTETSFEIPLVDYEDHELLLIATDNASCTDSLAKIFGPPLPIYVPTAFTPDNDGLNEIWQIKAPQLDRYDLKVFDRLGNLIFESTDQYEGWDGVLRGTGNIVKGTYVAKIIAERGTQRKDLVVSFTLIR